MKCQKSYCLKQVNPDVPNLYFGIPFERDENWFGCWLCDRKRSTSMEIEKEGRFARGCPLQK